jgi:PAS domain S-box-containing protein
MVETEISASKRQKSKLGRAPDMIGLIIALTSVLVSLLLIYYWELNEQPFRQLLRYISIIPVCYVAYQYGMKAGIGLAIFFSTIFLPQLYLSARANLLSPLTIQSFAYIIFINTFAYVIADIANSIRTHEVLSSTVRDWGTLLAKTSALDEVIKFILEQTKTICKAETSIFLLRNPLDAQWEINTLEEKLPLPLSSNPDRERMTLAEWLLDQDKSLVLNNLDEENSFIVSPPGAVTGEIWSLLAQPLRHGDGTLMGMLVLLNKEHGDFTKLDLQELKELVNGGERALEQAGLYARTDYALARRVRQLAAIQRTARELNATLDPKQIIERTLECALEITDGEAGFISLDMKGFPPIFQTFGARVDEARAPLLVAQARELERAAILTSDETSIPPLLPQANSRLLAPIKRENQTLGIVIVESSSPRIFKEASRHVLTILADHAAIALENARLFQESQMEKQRVSLIIHSIADGLFTTDGTGHILTFNPAAEQLTGWSSEETVGRVCCEVLGCHNLEEADANHCQLLQALSQQRGTYIERYIIRQKSGTKRVISISMAPLPANNETPFGSVFLFRDITEQDEMERLQKELIAAISHELRAPLSHISTITETLTESDDIAMKPYYKYLDNLMVQTKRLADFSDRILDVYQLETGRLNLQLRPLPVCLLVDELIKQWEVNSAHHDLMVHLPEKSPWVWADEDGFKTVMNNLVDNAVKYSPPNTKIDIFVKQTSRGFITCAVQDQGLGIGPEFQTKIFQRFYRLDGGDSQRVYGHGLGLYIAKTLVEAMSGEIWVESEVGKGSYFAFRLPIMEEGSEGKNTDY